MKIIKIMIVCFFSMLISSCFSYVVSQKENVSAAAYHVQLGLGYLEAGDVERAYHKLQLALKENPTSSESLNAMAYYYEYLGEDDLAKEMYEKAVKQSPSGRVLNNYGIFLCYHDDYQEAMKQFTLAAKDHNYAAYKTYENAGACALSYGDKEKALSFLERALVYQPQDKTLRALYLKAIGDRGGGWALSENGD